MRGMTFLVAFLLIAPQVHAQPSPPNIPSVASSDGGADALPDATPAGVIKELTALRAAKASGDKTSSYIAFAALIALALKVLIDRLKKIPASDLTDRAKHAIPWVIAALSFAAAVVWKYSTGQTWTNAIVLAGGGPGAILVDNLWDAFLGLIKKKPKESGKDS